MHKMVVLYREPADKDQFLRHYNDVHLPLVTKIPGLLKAEVTRFNRTLMGEKFFLMAEMCFADADSFKAAMKSPENAATGADLANFAEGLATVLIGESVD